MSEAVAACLAGTISPEVAVARMLLGGADAAGIERAVGDARPEPPTPRWRALRALLDGRGGGLDRLAGEIRETGGDHTLLDGVSAIAAFFDRAVTHSPEAGVALHSLGDPAILAAATAEIVEWLGATGLLRPDGDVLDVGCGFGRVTAALAPACRSALGVDVSGGMVAEARRRHAGLANVRFAVTDGRSLPPGPHDLVLLVDSMPYILQAGLAEAVVEQACASLRPGGALAILGLSYGRDPGRDAADAARWATRFGLALHQCAPFRLWAAHAFVLQSRAGAARAPGRT